MQEISHYDGERAEVEGGGEALVLAENKRGGEDAVNGFEIHGEIEVVGGNAAEQAVGQGLGKHGATQSQDGDPEPVHRMNGGQRGETDGIEQRHGKETDQRGGNHFPADHDHGIAAVDDEGAVEDEENRGQQRAEQSQAKPWHLGFFHSGDQTDPRKHKKPEDYFERLDAAAGEQRLGEGGEQGERGKTGKGDGDVGKLHRPEKTKPVQPDDRADARKFRHRFPAEPDFPVAHHPDPQERAKRREQAAPRDQHRRADRGQPSEDGRRRKDGDEKMELEKRADTAELRFRGAGLEAKSPRSGASLAAI